MLIHGHPPLAQVRRKSEAMASLVAQMDDLANKYIDLANLDVAKAKEDGTISTRMSDWKLASVKNKHNVAVVTRATPVDPSGEYVAPTPL